MIKREWQSLLKDKFMVVVVIAIMIIPTIYTTIFLGSMWDPYGEVEKLPVAVVNEDESVVYNDETMDVGSELVKNLKENNSLDFNFVDKDVANQGLENGTYYMVVTIPKDFSKNATTLMDENPKQMKLEYEINPGTNYIASKLSQTAANKIRNSVQEKITKQYAETIFDKIGTLGDGLTEAADGTEKALDGVSQLKDGNKQITDNLELLASSSLEFKDGAETLKVGLSQYANGVSTAESGSKQLQGGIAQYTQGVASAKDGSNKIEAGLNEFNGKIPVLVQGVQTLDNNSSKLNAGVKQLGVGSTSILNGLNQMSNEIGQSLNDESKEKLQQAEQGLDALNQGIQGLNEAAQSSDSTNAAKGIETSLTNIGINTKKVGETYKDTVAQIQNTSAFNSLSQDQKNEILNVLQNNGSVITSELQTIGQETQNTANIAKEVNDNVNKLKGGINTIATNSNLLLPSSKEAIVSLSTGLGNVKDALDRKGTTPETMGLIQGMSQVEDGINNERTGLYVNLQAYTNGVRTINSQVPTLSSGVKALYSGSKELSNGLGILDSKAAELNGGIQSLSNGLGTITSNNNTLLSGVDKLADGAVQISDGAGKLSDGSKTLGNGLNDLYDGTVTLNKGLQDGADEINSMNSSDKTYKMMASPVDTDETEMTKVDNNGNAMAPYMMCVGLWVGCLAFCLMYPLTSHEGEVESGFKWWLSKASILGLVTIAQAIIMVFMLKGINGLNPVEVGKTVFIACLASVTFMSIMYFFNILFGKVGSFVMLIFMVLQLGGCAGTYPLELAAKFYSIINPYMPFTYCVHAFRSAICGGASITKDIVVLLSILAVFVILTIVVFNVKARKAVNDNGEATV